MDLPRSTRRIGLLCLLFAVVPLVLALRFVPPGAATGMTLSSVSVNPNIIPVNGTTTGTVKRSTSGANTVVNLRSGNTAIATVPSRVTIYSKSTSASFTVSAATPVGGCTWIRAQSGTEDPRLTTLFVAPPYTPSRSAVRLDLASGSAAPPALTTLHVPFGVKVSGTVTLSSPAGARGVSVSLVSNIPSSIEVPPSVFIPAGKNSASFSVNQKNFAECSIVTAILGLSRSSKMLILLPMDG